MENVQKTLLFMSKKRKKLPNRWLPNGRCGFNFSRTSTFTITKYFALQIYTHSQLCTDFKHTSICNSSIHQIHDYFL